MSSELRWGAKVYQNLKNRVKTAVQERSRGSIGERVHHVAADCKLCLLYEKPLGNLPQKTTATRKRLIDASNVKTDTHTADVMDIPTEEKHIATSANSVVVPRDVLLAAIAATGISTSQGVAFAQSLETQCQSRGIDLSFQGNVLREATFLNRVLMPFCGAVSMGVGVGCACIVRDWKGFLMAACELDNVSFDDVVLSTWSCDHGGTSLKMTISLEFSPTIATERPLKRQAVHKLSRRSGVRKLLLVGMATDVSETYGVLAEFFKLLRLHVLFQFLRGHGVDIAFTNDMKLSWIIHAKTAGGLHGCNYCVWTPADGLEKYPRHEQRSWLDDYNDHRRWLEATRSVSDSKAKSMVKHFNNCLRPSLVSDLFPKPTDLIIDMFWPALLHLKLRNCNKLLHLLQQASADVHEAWLSTACVRKAQYHGGDLEGGPIDNLLSKVPLLRRAIQAEIRAQVLAARSPTASPLNEQDLQKRIYAAGKLHPARAFPQAFKALYHLLRLTGCRELQEGIPAGADVYRRSIFAIGCIPTISMHVLVHEVPKFCERRKCGLGMYSEQAAEAMHYEEHKFHKRWTVPSPGHPRHAKRLLEVMGALNSELHELQRD